MKFVILDEVDYMTKSAQQAFRYLLHEYTENVRFCLICNYISRIDDGLQTEFLKLRFIQLPKQEIMQFLKKISNAENLQMNDKTLSAIQQIYKSDIRSMLNCIQSNMDINNKYYIIFATIILFMLMYFFYTTIKKVWLVIFDISFNS